MLLLAPYPASLPGLLLFALSNTLQAFQLRAIRQRLSPPEVIGNVQGSSMALLSLGALLGNLIPGLIGEKAVEWPPIYAIAGQIALFAFALGPLSPKGIARYHKLSLIEGGQGTRRRRTGGINETAPFRAAFGGGGGIRTRGTLAGTPVFETGPFNRSGTPPSVNGRKTRIRV